MSVSLVHSSACEVFLRVVINESDDPRAANRVKTMHNVRRQSAAVENDIVGKHSISLLILTFMFGRSAGVFKYNIICATRSSGHRQTKNKKEKQMRMQHLKMFVMEVSEIKPFDVLCVVSNSIFRR